MLARNGGEAFIALFMPAERRRILELAELLRQAVRALAIEHAASPAAGVTLSIGVSVLVPAPGLHADALVRAADLAL
ncbi:MAG: diguanylate cyclase [Xanthomonadaceae bacterium]|nr:diguanylate cyclase [Xanthomonadaceae bacterium]MDE1958941.1 diguanylate cyclase [Xanthomonadaceae bacterium]MDE2178237.1 diguanylate cyclase [Xanthomonadaceae bacterium]MDE2246661.1 diguanylate cyclase [Xanthomonadaceae bacterium]